MYFPPSRTLIKDWRDSSVNKLLATQAELNPRAQVKRPGMVVCVCIPSAGGARDKQIPEARQDCLVSSWLVRDCFKSQDSRGMTPEIVLGPPHACT